MSAEICFAVMEWLSALPCLQGYKLNLNSFYAEGNTGALFTEGVPQEIKDICGASRFKSDFSLLLSYPIGGQEAGNVGDGFYALEQAQQVMVQMSRGYSDIVLPTAYVIEDFIVTSTGPVFIGVEQTELYSIAKYSIKFYVIYTREAN